jgi:hypothetical protein
MALWFLCQPGPFCGWKLAAIRCRSHSRGTVDERRGLLISLANAGNGGVTDGHGNTFSGGVVLRFDGCFAIASASRRANHRWKSLYLGWTSGRQLAEFRCEGRFSFYAWAATRKMTLSTSAMQFLLGGTFSKIQFVLSLNIFLGLVNLAL